MLEVVRQNPVDLRYSFTPENMRGSFEDVFVVTPEKSHRLIVVKDNGLYERYQGLLQTLSAAHILAGKENEVTIAGVSYPCYEISRTLRPIENELFAQKSSQLSLGVDRFSREVGEIAAVIDSYRGESGQRHRLPARTVGMGIGIDDFIRRDARMLYVSPTAVGSLEESTETEGQLRAMKTLFTSPLMQQLMQKAYVEYGGGYGTPGSA